jgi:hypothetical protein
VYLIQVLLPLYDNQRRPLPKNHYLRVRDELTERYGGLTAYSRAPAEGLWKRSAHTTSHDEIVIFEVMTATLDKAWWREYRRQLELRFRQELIVIRAQRIEML